MDAFYFHSLKKHCCLQKLLRLEPVLGGAVTRAKKQASWVGPAPSTGRPARAGASVATRWFIAISVRRKEGEQDGEEKKEGGETEDNKTTH